MVSRRAVNGAGVKQHAVARFHVPADNVVGVAVGFNVGNFPEFPRVGTRFVAVKISIELVDRAALCRVAEKGFRHQRLAPGMRTAHEFECRSEEHTSELPSLMRISYAVS